MIEDINRHDALKAAVDIASGINAGSGGIMNAAVKADITYTFSYEKTGQILWREMNTQENLLPFR